MAPQPTNAGIITDDTGVRHIPESTRPDGTTRRAIKIRPGYQPPEDVALYKNRTAELYRNRMKNGVPGAEPAPKEEERTERSSPKPAAVPGIPGSVPGSVPGASSNNADEAAAPSASASAAKNAKRREARKKAAAAAATAVAETKDTPDAPRESQAQPSDVPAPASAAAAAFDDREKKARGLKKKLKQAKELKNKRDGGEALLPEQIAKVIRINELIRELGALGFDVEDEAKAGEEKEDAGKTT